MMSTLRYTSANGGGGKAVPPKWFCGCRRGLLGSRLIGAALSQYLRRAIMSICFYLF